MIREICLNPVIDRMYFVNGFESGKLFRNLSPKEYVGGKGVNIAKALSGFEVTHCCYLLTAGNNGEKIKSYLKSANISYKSVETLGETRTTINIIDHQESLETELLENGPEVSQDKQREILEILSNDIEKDDIIICSGIGARGMDKTIYQQIAKLCKTSGALCVVDTNDCWLKETLPSEIFMIKPNAREIKEFFNVSHKISEEGLVLLAKNFFGLNVANILISLGEKGSLLLTADRIFKADIPAVKVVSTIGSGDSSVAGFCYGISKKLSPQEALKYAMAFGISNAMHKAAGNVDASEVASLIKEIKVTECDLSQLSKVLEY